MLAATQTTGNKSEIIAYLDSTAWEPYKSRAKSAIEKLMLDTLIKAVELQDSHGRSILFTGRETIRQIVRLDAPREISAAKPLTGIVGKIYHIGDSMYYPVISTVTQAGRPIGYTYPGTC